MSVTLHDVSAAVLAGGLGTRLRAAVPDRPKVLATVAGRPFLAHLLDRLARASVREVVLLTGHAADQVHAAFGDRYAGMRLTYSVEPAPLGTAGAVRHALPLFRSETVLLVNGDSYCDADLAAFRRSHAEEPSGFGMVLAARRGRLPVRPGRGRRRRPRGPLRGEGAGRPSRLDQRRNLSLPRALLEGLEPTRPASLERDLLPAWVAAGRVRGFRAEGRFIDIGTPESYAAAEAFFHAAAA